MSPMRELWSRGWNWNLAEFIDFLNAPTLLEERKGIPGWADGVVCVCGLSGSGGIRVMSVFPAMGVVGKMSGIGEVG